MKKIIRLKSVSELSKKFNGDRANRRYQATKLRSCAKQLLRHGAIVYDKKGSEEIIYFSPDKRLYNDAWLLMHEDDSIKLGLNNG